MEMKPQHTPEPWTIGGRVISADLSHPIRLDLPDNDAIYITGTNKEANARLVILAPEMLETLYDALDLLLTNETYRGKVTKDKIKKIIGGINL